MSEGELLIYLQTHRCHACDAWLLAMTHYVSVLTGMVLLFLIYETWFRKVLSRKYFWYVTLALILTAAMVHLLKWGIGRPRPFKVVAGLRQMTDGGQSSFPSGHTAEVFTLLFALWRLHRFRVLTVLLAAGALLIAYTRMVFGVHYPTDILGGIGVAMLSAGTAPYLLKLFYHEK